MRGRVGRFTKRAYAYFVVEKRKELSTDARKRLEAIHEYSELGSGFKIAMEDLEIRGAGNLLGIQQHGHIENIGFDLYCRLLREAVAALEKNFTMKN
jgi:transcription-repair coupling factor (superfamily II helicase)